MSIPDPTIDPVTNLPVLNPMDVVQQIPLGVQTFPWQDFVATARPTRSPIYGDDILTVSAFVAGQHPGTGSAQTVETDGSHAMKVYQVNAGSGGGGTAPVAQLRTQGVQASGVLPGDGTLFTIPIGGSDLNTLFRADVGVYMAPPGAGSVTPGSIGLTFTPDTSNAHNLWARRWQGPFASTDPAIRLFETIYFNPGWDMFTEFGGGQNCTFTGQGPVGCIYTCILYYI